MLKPNLKLVKLMLLSLAIVLTGCAEPSVKYEASPVTPESLSPLARQPQKPSSCLPACSKKATELTSKQQTLLTELLMQEKPVNSNTTQ